MAKRIIPLVLILALTGYLGHKYWVDRKARSLDRSFYGTVEAVEVLVSAQVTGPVANVVVTQRFGNPLTDARDEHLALAELDYLFPLPEKPTARREGSPQATSCTNQHRSTNSHIVQFLMDFHL